VNRNPNTASIMTQRLALAAALAVSWPGTAPAQDLGGDLTLHRLLIDGEGWQLVADNLQFPDGPCADGHGNFYFAEMRSTPPVIWRISPAGEKSKLIEGTSASGLKFGPDGRLYACVGKDKQLVVFEVPGGKKTVLAEDVQPNDLVVSHKGHIYFTETGKKQVTFLNPKTGEKKAADVGITAPNGITLSPDQGTLAVSDSRGTNTWTLRIEPDGSLSAKAPYMTMRTAVDPAVKSADGRSPVYKSVSGGDGMTSDSLGRYYVSSHLGVQVFDPTGRMCGVLPNPGAKQMTSVGFAGPRMDFMYVTCSDRIFRRKVQATGNLFFRPPVQ
jgi:sugar lactone lactonase YvrE